MGWRVIISAVAVVCLVWAGCGQKEEPKAPAASASSAPAAPDKVTADIQAGIEQHIEKQVSLGGGYFQLPFKDKQLRLKLVRVHTEYLSKLGPGRYFACVDLADFGGDVYDVDFFLAGEPGAMKVTETTVHKINGQPYYAWEQKADGTWHRIPVKAASDAQLGVIRGKDEFEFSYKAVLPEITGPARLWLPLAATDAFQTVAVKAMDTPRKPSILRDRDYSNQVLFLELGPQDGGKTVEIRYHVKRLEKAAYAPQTPDQEKYLKPERLVPTNEDFRRIAEQVVHGKQGDLMRGRALYDHVSDQLRYMKYGTGWGQGDAVYACNARTGNCTDFHSYFIALARAVGIPARFAIGAAIPSERNEGGVDGYHCWAEFFAEGKWWPVDISEGNKYTSLATYYFGHHPANRFEFSRGRDLTVEPGPASGSINFLAYPVLEIDGKPVKVPVEFSFNRSHASSN
jgi:transglutaminase-like putative cysteine protease